MKCSFLNVNHARLRGASAAVLLLPLCCLTGCGDSDTDKAQGGNQGAVQKENIRVDIKDDATAKKILTEAALRYAEKNPNNKNNLIVGLLQTPDRIKQAVAEATPKECMILAVQAECLPVCVYEQETNKVQIDTELLVLAAGCQNGELVQYLVSCMPVVSEEGLALLCAGASQEVFAAALAAAPWGVDCSEVLNPIVQQVQDIREGSPLMGNVKYMLENYPMNDMNTQLCLQLRNYENPLKLAIEPLCCKAIERTLALPGVEHTEPNGINNDEEYVAAWLRGAKLFLHRYPENHSVIGSVDRTTEKISEDIRRFLTPQADSIAFSQAVRIGSLPCCTYLVEKKGCVPMVQDVITAMRWNQEKLVNYLIEHDGLAPNPNAWSSDSFDRAEAYSNLLSGSYVDAVKLLFARGVNEIKTDYALNLLVERTARPQCLNMDCETFHVSVPEMQRRRKALIRFFVEERNGSITPELLELAQDEDQPDAEFLEFLRQLAK